MRHGGGLPDGLRRGQVEASYILKRAESLGLFLRYHAGFDYYNIRFQDKGSFWTFGFMWDVGRLDRLNSELPPSKTKSKTAGGDTSKQCPCPPPKT